MLEVGSVAVWEAALVLVEVILEQVVLAVAEVEATKDRSLVPQEAYTTVNPLLVKTMEFLVPVK